MKKIFPVTLFCMMSVSASSQRTSLKEAQPDTTKKTIIVEASCGQCQFHMAGKGCDLAVRIDGKTYFVDGTSIDEHGDAHARDGFCESIRKAKVQGEIVNNRFKATYFVLLTPGKKKNE
ncbi:MAG: DUF6370 family protein [Chitinophagaceae bacterium]